MAAERIGRRAYAMDVEPHYVDVAVRRWQTFTKKDAVNAESGLTFDQLAERAGAVPPTLQGKAAQLDGEVPTFEEAKITRIAGRTDLEGLALHLEPK
jgi:hypothetical protein